MNQSRVFDGRQEAVEPPGLVLWGVSLSIPGGTSHVIRTRYLVQGTSVKVHLPNSKYPG